MSNSIGVDVNKVENVISKTTYFEITAWDDYNNGSISLEEVQLPTTDIETLQLCQSHGSECSIGIYDVISTISEFEKGVTVNGNFYEWEEIKHLFG